MKRRKYYYTQNKHLAPNRTIGNWLKCKDRFWKWVTTDYIQDVFGIELRPKRRHRRSISVRDIGRLYGTDIDWLQSKIDYPRWSFSRRVYRKSKDGTVWYGALMRIYFYKEVQNET